MGGPARGRGAAAMSAVTESESYRRWPQALDEAAFFDLDKTIIAKDAMAAFGGPLRKQGLMKRRSLAQVVLAQVIYLILGSNDRRLDRIRAAVLRLTKGWSQAEVVAIVNDALESVVEPIIYDEAMDLIDDHHSAGRRVVIVSASPSELVQPLGRRLGVDATIASEAAVDAAGCYTGELAFYAAGPQKAEAVRAYAAQGRRRPRALVRLQRLAHRPAAARDRRPPCRGESRPRARQGRRGTRLGDRELHPTGPPARPGAGPDARRAAPAGDRHRDEHRRRRGRRRCPRLVAPLPTTDRSGRGAGSASL